MLFRAVVRSVFQRDVTSCIYQDLAHANRLHQCVRQPWADSPHPASTEGAMLDLIKGRLPH